MVILPAEKARISAESRTGFLGLNLCPPARVGFQLRDLQQADRVQVGTVSKLQRTLSQVFLLQIAGSCLGLAQGALDRALDYAGQREQFGRKIGSFPAIRRKLARMTVKVAESRLMVYHGAACFDRGGLKDQDAAMIKLQAAETAREVADEAIQVLGGYGYMREYDVERFCREAKACEILAGSAGSQLDAVASGFSKKVGLK
jgi:alkylation response protein AidB-like acyl-CoA dehydrogenase